MFHRGMLARCKDFGIANLDVILRNRADGVACHRVCVKGDFVGVEVTIGAQDLDVAGENRNPIFLKPFQVVRAAVNLFAFLFAIRRRLGLFARFKLRLFALNSLFCRSCF